MKEEKVSFILPVSTPFPSQIWVIESVENPYCESLRFETRSPGRNAVLSSLYSRMMRQVLSYTS